MAQEGGIVRQVASPDIAGIDSLRARMAMSAQLRNAENVYLQVQEGVVDESVLQSYAFTSRRYESAAFAQFWRVERMRYDPLFVSAFEAANSIGQ